jgi:hypothetical protein
MIVVASSLRSGPARGGSIMLMFKRSQLYIAFALAALAEIIVRAFAR